MKPHLLLFGDVQSFMPADYTLYPSSPEADIAVLLKTVKPAAVIIDMSSPALNGVRVCGLVKTYQPAVRVIALHRDEPYLRRAALAAGADVVLDFPPDLPLLREWLDKPAEMDTGAIHAVFNNTADDVLGATAILSHDLKSPISIIISTLEVLVAVYEGAEENSNLRLLRGALSAAYRQINLVTDMLDLMRLEMGAYEMERHPCNVAELARDFVETEVQKLAVNKDFRLELDLPDAPLVAEADANLIWRMLYALVDNINKFTVHNDLLRLEGHNDGQFITLTFADTGRPIMPGFERRIVERPPQWKDREAGTRTSVAMGLPFVYAAARAQGGSLSAYSDPQTGLTTFTLTLPAARLDEMQHG